jgi:N-acyl-D-aspartate/D-glutamate deacylase
MTTSYLAMWARDRQAIDGLPLQSVVHQISQRPAQHLGWLDRGVLAPGYLADLNIIDLDALACAPPEIATDLPAGGRRLLQAGRGYRYTLKRGTVTFEGGAHTGELPGRLLRGAQAGPG